MSRIFRELYLFHESSPATVPARDSAIPVDPARRAGSSHISRYYPKRASMLLCNSNLRKRGLTSSEMAVVPRPFRIFQRVLLRRSIQMAQQRQTNEDPRRQTAERPGRQQNEDVRQQRNEEMSAESSRRQGQQESFGGRGREPVDMAATTLRGFGQLYDMEAASARIFMRAQARALSAMGFPDYSHFFELADERAKRLFSTTTDTLLQSNRHANRTAGEIQRHLGRLWEQQTMDLTEAWQTGLQELQHQATESLDDLKELVRQQADELAMATDSLSESTRETLREGGEQFRATMREGFERSRELTGRQAETALRQGEELAEETREAGEEARAEMSRGGEATRSERGSRSHKAA
ncbi:hypothetical protein [Aromatoleum anaerobium]|uniref:Phasin family protein n=1 Tax=Aromatoleum anaerobium TaxID=182180 RepID=A0ABX1PID2_9RHOO|nr:hypothetical protein [Aromatoleum anaerobium]MCK0508359.1 apolipoprotein A1/A4/E family protein [Aromatoleum anaerobium]